MAKIRVSKRQNIIDVAVQKAGSANAAFEIAEANGLAVTDYLEPGQEIEVPNVHNADRVNYFENKGIKPETAENDLPDDFDQFFDVEFFEEME